MKILIISYYSFPLNAVPSYRIESFCEGFTKKGADVTLITRHWDNRFQSWGDVLASNLKDVEIKIQNGYRTIRLPYLAKPKDSANRLVSTLSTVKDYLVGNLQTETNAYSNFKDYALNLIRQEGDFDLIYVSGPPNNLVKLAHFLNGKTNVPYVVDFRDFLNDRYLYKHRILDKRTKVLNALTAFHVKRWLKNSSLVVTVSPRLQSIFEDEFKKSTLLALNGYEQKHFSNEKISLVPNEIFTIRYIGTAYDGLNFDFIIEGLRRFKEVFPNKSFKIELVGIHNREIEGKFSEEFNDNELLITHVRVSKEKVVEKTVNADLLLLVWNIFKDNFGTKVFDYLASGSHILLSPGDDGIVENLIHKCENGSVANSSEMVFKVLNEQYDKWLEGVNKTKINNYPQFARENIVVDLYKSLKLL